MNEVKMLNIKSSAEGILMLADQLDEPDTLEDDWIKRHMIKVLIKDILNELNH